MNIACIFAGGIGKRMKNKEMPKQFLPLHGKPIIVRTIEVFNNHPEIDGIIVACNKNWMDYLSILIRRYTLDKVIKVTEGGKTGQLSIYNTLVEADKLNYSNTIVLLHDAVRPLIDNEIISKNIRMTKKYKSCITTSRVSETVLLTTENNKLDSILKRSDLRIAKAPQSFYLKDILELHNKAIDDKIYDFVDSCTMMNHYGKSPYLLDGPDNNIKITTQEDYFIVKAIMDVNEDKSIFNTGE